ncbi:MAG: hypothetical protein IJ492_04820, partial [Clostridia bacterium]|nr:hypothetical protein [Clostridia bacterium]
HKAIFLTHQTQQEKHLTLCTEATKNVVDKTTKQKALCTKVQGAFLIILYFFVMHFRCQHPIQTVNPSTLNRP